MRKSIVVNPDDRECAVCGKTIDLQWHHIIHGTANRVMSDRYGITCWLCLHCHTNLHNSPQHYWRDVDHQLQATAQRKFEDKYSHEKWMEIFKKNYLDD